MGGLPYRPQRFPALILPFLLATAAAPTHATTWVITDSHNPVHGQPDRLILLDAAEQLEAELSADLPTALQRAAALAQQRLQSGGTSLQKRLADAYQGITDAWSLGIVKIPAIVIDQRHVIYGEHDIEAAQAKVRQFLRGQP